jgi:hypothetical protein
LEFTELGELRGKGSMSCSCPVRKGLSTTSCAGSGGSSSLLLLLGTLLQAPLSAWPGACVEFFQSQLMLLPK